MVFCGRRKDHSYKKGGLYIKGFTLIEVIITLLIAITIVLLSAGIYDRATRQARAQTAAFILAGYLEQAEALGQSLTNGNTNCRLTFNSTNNQFSAEIYNPNASASNKWIPAIAISSSPLPLTSGVTFNYPSGATSPDYGLGNLTIAGAVPQPTTAMSGVIPEIRFNSRGFPVEWPNNPPTTLKPRNEVYLTDGQFYYAVTVNPLGRVEVWTYTKQANSFVWLKVSREN